MCGGAEARIAILPTASSLPDTGERYERIFRRLEAREAFAVHYQTREDTARDDRLERLESATGIFLTGGNQLRIPVILSEHMIAYGEAGATPHAGQAVLSPGLGLTNRVVIDQHFRQRDRLGRLLAALAYNPFAVGLGLDEDTAAFIDPKDVLHVAGADAITVVDPSQLEYSSMPHARIGQVVCLTNVRLHVLTEGASFDLQLRGATPPDDPGPSAD